MGGACLFGDGRNPESKRPGWTGARCPVSPPAVRPCLSAGDITH